MSPGQKFRWALLAVAGLNVIGTIGYRFFEGWAWLDCLYMTFITLATIGFGEVHPLSPEGRIFTMVLFWTTTVVLALAISTAGQALLQSELLSTLGRKRRVFKDISKLRDHHIVCGAGRVGRHVIKEMEQRGAPFVVVESDEGRAEKLLEQGNLVLMGDATDEEVLQGAGVEYARSLVCCLPSDADNLYAVITARGLNPNIHIVARASEEAAISKMRKAGANKVVSPVIIGSQRIAVAALSPAVSDFIELVTKAEVLDLNIEQVEVSRDSILVGQKLKDSGIRQQYDVIIIAIKRSGGAMIFNPSGETEISAGDVLVAVGGLPELERLAGVANPASVSAKRHGR
ncbi:MAG: potassium channel protein [Acidobacteria bacterium]|nr:potassium channel protein [Acidobacteriota bacterium]